MRGEKKTKKMVFHDMKIIWNSYFSVAPSFLRHRHLIQLPTVCGHAHSKAELSSCESGRVFMAHEAWNSCDLGLCCRNCLLLSWWVTPSSFQSFAVDSLAQERPTSVCGAEQIFLRIYVVPHDSHFLFRWSRWNMQWPHVHAAALGGPLGSMETRREARIQRLPLAAVCHFRNPSSQGSGRKNRG